MNLTRNNNEGVIKRLANSSLKANRSRNIPIIATIAIALCLVTFFLLLPLNIQKRTQNELDGRFQASVYNVSEDEISALKAEIGDENVGFYADLGTIQTAEYTLNIAYNDANALRLGKVKIQGVAPERENDLLVSGNLLSFFDIGIGDALELDIGLGLQTYRICGTAGNIDEGKDFGVTVSPAVLAAFRQNNGDRPLLSAHIYVPGINGFSLDEQLKAIYTVTGTANITENRVFVSNFFKRSLQPAGLSTMLAVAGIALLLLTTSGMVIYSIFYISTVNNVREFGRLRALGATRRQIRQVVRRQGITLALLGGLLGIVLGNILSFAVTPDGWSITTGVWTFFVLMLLACLVVLMALRKPAKIASGITPAEALRYTTADSGAGRKPHRFGLVKRSTPARLAALNFMRNKKKTAATLLSLSLAGILLGAAGSFFSSISIEKMVRTELHAQGDFFITLDSSGLDNTDGYGTSRLQQNNPINEKLIGQVEALPGVDRVWAECAAKAMFTFPNGVENDGNMGTFLPEESKGISAKLDIGACDYAQMVQNNGIIVMVNDTLQEISGWKSSPGDMVTLQFWTPGGLVERDFTVTGTTNSRLKEATFLVPQETLDSIAPGNTNYRVVVQAREENIEQVDAALRALIAQTPHLHLDTITDMYAAQKNMMQLFGAVTLALLFVVAAFGLISLINTIITSVLSRKQELGILQAVGMTNKQLGQTILVEGFTYSGITALATMTIGTLVGYALCHAVNALTSNPFLDYTFPAAVVGIFLAVLCIAQIMVSLQSIRIYRKESLTERIKQGS